jgi:hypothetical protein
MIKAKAALPANASAKSNCNCYAKSSKKVIPPEAGAIGSEFLAKDGQSYRVGHL